MSPMQTVVTSLVGHKEKVQSLQWNHSEAQTLLTGCCDKTVIVKYLSSYIFTYIALKSNLVTCCNMAITVTFPAFAFK